MGVTASCAQQERWYPELNVLNISNVCHDTHVEVSNCWELVFLLLRNPGIELRSSGLHGKHFYLLKHLTSLSLGFQWDLSMDLRREEERE